MKKILLFMLVAVVAYSPALLWAASEDEGPDYDQRLEKIEAGIERLNTMVARLRSQYEASAGQGGGSGGGGQGGGGSGGGGLQNLTSLLSKFSSIQQIFSQLGNVLGGAGGKGGCSSGNCGGGGYLGGLSGTYGGTVKFVAQCFKDEKCKQPDPMRTYIEITPVKGPAAQAEPVVSLGKLAMLGSLWGDRILLAAQCNDPLGRCPFNPLGSGDGSPATPQRKINNPLAPTDAAANKTPAFSSLTKLMLDMGRKPIVVGTPQPGVNIHGTASPAPDNACFVKRGACRPVNGSTIFIMGVD